MKGELSFIIFTEISSHPYEVEDFKDLMTFYFMSACTVKFNLCESLFWMHLINM